MTENQVRHLFAEMLEEWANRVRCNVVEEPLENLVELMHGQAMDILMELTDADAEEISLSEEEFDAMFQKPEPATVVQFSEAQ